MLFACSFRVLWGFIPWVVLLTLVAVCICLYHQWLEVHALMVK